MICHVLEHFVEQQDSFLHEWDSQRTETSHLWKEKFSNVQCNSLHSSKLALWCRFIATFILRSLLWGKTIPYRYFCMFYLHAICTSHAAEIFCAAFAVQALELPYIDHFHSEWYGFTCLLVHEDTFAEILHE